MYDETEIRRNGSGAIDTAYYCRQGRALHGAAIRNTAHLLLRVAIAGAVLTFSAGAVLRAVPA